MSFWSEVEGIFEPGGDPEAIQAAATGCQALAGDLRGIVAALDPVAADLKTSWKGRAGEAFQKAWAGFGASLTEYAGSLDQAAARLASVAGAIRTAQQEAARLKEIALGTLAAGAVLTVFTAGISDGAAIDAAMADVAVETGVMTSLDAFLADLAASLEDLLGAFVKVAARFALGSAFSAISLMIDTAAVEHENPFDPANYNAQDVSDVLIAGIAYAGLGAVSDTGPVSDFKAAHPVLGNAATSAASGLASSSLSDFLVYNEPPNAGTFEEIGESAGISAISGSVIGALSKAPGPVGSLFGTSSPGTSSPGTAAPGTAAPGTSSPGTASPGTAGVTGISRTDLVKGVSNIPATVLKDALFDTPPGSGPPVPHPPAAPAGLPVPVAHPAPATLPPHVVRPGESLWEIAGGSAALTDQIADLNRLSDPNLIFPGQVLRVPSAP